MLRMWIESEFQAVGPATVNELYELYRMYTATTSIFITTTTETETIYYSSLPYIIWWNEGIQNES